VTSTVTKWIARALVVLVVLVGLLVAYTAATLSWSYAKGDRAGYLQKFSRRGWVCKTWEGELNMIAIPGASPEKFFFSVRDEGVASRLNAAMGKRVSLTYEQHIGVPTTCFGDTEYFITGVAVVE
jgi:hypothetical protein